MFLNGEIRDDCMLARLRAGRSMAYNNMCFAWNIRRGGAGKSLARPTSRCRRTESIVSMERVICSCAELQVISCYRG